MDVAAGLAGAAAVLAEADGDTGAASETEGAAEGAAEPETLGDGEALTDLPDLAEAEGLTEGLAAGVGSVGLTGAGLRGANTGRKSSSAVCPTSLTSES